MFVFLKISNNPASIILEFLNTKIVVSHKVYGITQDPKTENYMVILKDICKKCNEVCNSIRFQRNFKNWTSDDDKFGKVYRANWTDGCINVDFYSGSWDNKNKIWKRKDQNMFVILKILNNPATHNDVRKKLEWIPYDRFYDIKYIAKGGFGKVYRTKWIDGYINKWDDRNQDWKRKYQNMVVALKSLNNSKDVTLEFMNEINNQIKEAEIINKKILSGSTFSTSLQVSYIQTHSDAIYTSRLLDFNNLPEPKNSDDYYEENENIISMKFSESLQIDISQLKINNSFELKNSDDSYEKNDNIKMKSSESLQIDTLQLKIDNNNFPEQDNSDENNDNMISMNSSESLQIDISQLNTNKDGKYSLDMDKKTSLLYNILILFVHFLNQDSKSKGKEKI
ncbi:hypothetical protein C1646_673084 [Rhizophagus diaphanus]|nr:hypothetical protein C1646_673084 [Rhizophagus diaphanus] [Rhizophagus sp. MUCL 43196]